MEQIVLYLAVLAALSGFGMGLMNLFGPYLKRRQIALPSISFASLRSRFARRLGDDEDDFGYEDEDDLDTAREFAESSFAATNNSLLVDRRVAIDEEELDEELVSVLNQVVEEELALAEGEDGLEADGVATEDIEAEDAGADDDEDGEDEEDEEDKDEAPAQPEVKVVSGGGMDDMMSLFNEASDDVGKAHEAWREDLPEVSIDELLAEARAISQQFKGKKHNAA